MTPNSMLKNFALLIPSLNRLHAERNLYAASIRALAEENSLLKTVIQNTSQVELKKDEEASFKDPKTNPIEPRDVSYLSGRGLFVVGHARSGTTILLDALNSCKDIYCLGEANFHKTIDKSDFVKWFNELHRSFDNPPMKSTYLPDFPVQDGWDVLKILSESYKLIGEKVAFRDEESGYDFKSFFKFSTRFFQKSNYVCVIRHPRNVSGSCIEMFMSGQLGPESLEVVATSQLQTYYLILSLAFSMPKVSILIHERISQATFDVLGCELGVNLRAAADFYDFDKSVSKLNLQENINDATLARPIYYYDLIKKFTDPESLSCVDSIGMRSILFELHSELKSLNRLPFLA